jgi:hypothetical protein
MIDHEPDQSAPARGIAWGFAISLGFWVLLLFIVHAFAG